MSDVNTPLSDLEEMRAFLTQLVDTCHQNTYLDREDPLGGYAYLRGRGVTEDQINTFKIGVGSRDKVWPPYELKGRKNASKFNEQFKGNMEGQLVFPVYNTRGTLRGIETRRWYDTMYRKYTQYFLTDWKIDAVFLGLPQALPHIWETQTVYLVEGMFDFFVVQRVFPNTLCTLTARVGFEQQRFLQRWARNVVYMFDSDTKGREATEKAMARVNVDSNTGYYAHSLKVPAKDPSEYYQKVGYARFKRELESKASKLNLFL